MLRIDPALQPPTEGDADGDASGAQSEAVRAWLDITRRNYDASTRYIDTHLRKQWDRNIRMFQGRHEDGSKYTSTDYRQRSKLFRPKTRAAIRRSEAAAASAFFATASVVSIAPMDDNDDAQQASAAITNELVNYHLQGKTQWFLACMGGYQTAQVHAVVISKQYWKFEEAQIGENFVPDLDPMTGQPMLIADETGAMVPSGRIEPVMKVVCDHPAIDLIPVDHVRIDPATDWANPIQASSYLIVEYPMTVGEVKAKMGKGPNKTRQPVWLEAGDAQIRAATATSTNTTENERGGKTGADRYERDGDLKDGDIVWVYECYAKFDGVDWTWWTLGTHALLTNPVPLYTITGDYERPFTMGYGNIEAFRPYPASKVEMGQDLQRTTNEITNQRIDNVRYVLNPRHFVRQGAGVDTAALMRSAPGSAVLMQDPQSDVATVKIPDVSASAYMEQDRINADYDDLLGTFSGASVATNRALNETVGGMQLLSGGANAVTEYDLRCFVETWAEPTLRQVVKLVQRYETDARILAIAGRKAQIYQRFGVNQITDELLNQELTVRVNVGIGSTDPMQQLQKFLMGANALTMFLQAPPHIMALLDVPEIVAEVFGKLGYKDGMRFFKFGDQDPQIAMLMQMLDQAKKEIEALKKGEAAKLQTAQIGAQATVSREQIQAQAQLAEQDLENQGDMQLELLRQQGQRQLEQQRIASQHRMARENRGMQMLDRLAGPRRVA